MAYIDPNTFVITRKRKKYKFAKFANSPLCYEFDDWTVESRDVVEVGAGNGLFSVELATRHPEKTYLAVDVKADRLQKGAYEASSRGLSNIVFLRARADQLKDIVPSKSIEQLWLTFPDPHPKKRSAGRRLTHMNFLNLYSSLLKDSGSLLLKHDDLLFFQWSLEQFIASQWTIAELSFDLHESTLDDEYKIATSYEERWLEEGKKTHLVRARLG